LIGPYERLTAEYNAAAKEAKNLAAQFGVESAQAKEASRVALELDQRLKAADASVGRFNKNVGNYSGALQTLEKALNEVKQKIDDVTKSGNQDAAIIETLQKEYGLLQTLVDAQSAGFKNATSEIRNNQQAILLLSQIYGEDSAVVQELTTKTGKLTDTVSDMKAEIKARASDTQVFDGLISAAQGLVGVYSIAQDTTALLGADNEDLQKTLVKVQAAMGILQGLQAIGNVLQKESQARQLAAVILNKIVTAQTTLQTAAESKSIVVRYAAAAAQKALNFAMSAAGGPILAVVAVLGLLLASFTSFGATTKEATLDLKKFNEEIELGAKFADEYQKDAEQRNALAISASKKRFEEEKKQRDLEIAGLEEKLAIQKKFIDENKKDSDLAAKYQKDAMAGRTKLDEDEFNKVKDAQLKYLDAKRKASELENQIAIKRNEDARASAVEEAADRRTNLDVTVADLNTRADFFRRIASDEARTYDDRIKASNAFYRQQVAIVELQKKQALDNPELKDKPEERAKIINDAANKEIILLRERTKAREDFEKQAAERERAARLNILKAELDERIKADEVIADDEKKSFNDRFNATYDAYNKRRVLLTAQRNLDIQNEKLTTEERRAIEAKYTSDVNQLTIDYGLKQLELYKVNQEQVTALIEKENTKRADIIATHQADAITALDEQFRQGKISVTKYNTERAALEEKYSIESLQNEVTNAFAKVLATKKGTTERYDAEKELAEKTQALSDATTKKQIENAQALRDKQIELGKQAYDFVKTIIDAQFTNRQNQVQQELDDVNKKKEADINAVNASTASEQEKANKIAVINATGAGSKRKTWTAVKATDSITAGEISEGGCYCRGDSQYRRGHYGHPAGLRALPTLSKPAFIAIAAGIGAIQLAKGHCHAYSLNSLKVRTMRRAARPRGWATAVSGRR
jgi:hypothetical protein